MRSGRRTSISKVCTINCVCFVSDATGIECKVTIDCINQFAAAEHIVLEAERATNDPQFTKLASDWRLMTRAEALGLTTMRSFVLESATSGAAA